MLKSVTRHSWGWNRVEEMQAWESVFAFPDYDHSEAWCRQAAALAVCTSFSPGFEVTVAEGSMAVGGTALLEDNTCGASSPRRLAPAPCPRLPGNRVRRLLRSSVATCAAREGFLSSLLRACQDPVRLLRRKLSVFWHEIFLSPF